MTASCSISSLDPAAAISHEAAHHKTFSVMHCSLLMGVSCLFQVSDIKGVSWLDACICGIETESRSSALRLQMAVPKPGLELGE